MTVLSAFLLCPPGVNAADPHNEGEDIPAVMQATRADPRSGLNTDLEQITVTGSRVITNGNNSPTPITVLIPSEMAEVDPGTIADELNDLPQLSGSRQQYTNPSGGSVSTSPAAPNAGANVINLRNMGFTRTLILMDGHRVAPTAPDGTVDIDMIPQMLLQRVDITTGGASAVYGSDAVTGVVNFITDTHFNGMKVNGQVGISTYGDDRTQDVGVAAGTNIFGDRGHLEASWEFRNDPGIRNRSDRPCCSHQDTVENLTGGAYGPYVLVPYARNSSGSFGGYIAPAYNPGSNPLTGMTFAQNGILSPFANGIQEGANTQSGGSGTYSNSTLKAQLIMQQLYGRFDYAFTEAAHGYAAIAFTHNYNWQQGGDNNLSTPNGSAGVTISATDPFLPLQYQNELASAGISTFKLSKTFTDIPASNASTWETQYSINAGVNVNLGDGYEWDSQYTQSRNVQTTRQNDNINTLNMVAALDAVINPANNQIVCAVSLTLYAKLYPGCAPHNPFGPTSESQAAINYVLGQTQFTAYTTMEDVTSSVTGAPLKIWAGPVNMAVSGEWRRLSYTLEPSAVPNGLFNEISCAGLPSYNCSATPSAQVWETGVSAWRSLVAERVGELAYEFDAPLAKDVILARNLSLNGAVRGTDYSTSGMAYTWKVGLDWQINNQLTLRGSRSRDIRAPTLNDLYLPTTASISGGTDNLTGADLGLNPVPLIAKGNPKLRPEIANAVTAGFVYRPDWLQGFNLSIDAFFINISDAITTIQGNSTTAQAGCAASGGTSPLCQLIVRPINCCNSSLANTATQFYAEPLNIASQWTEGADLESAWSTRVFDRPFSLRALVTYQPHLVYEIPGTPTYDMAGVAFNNNALQASPVWRATLLANYSPTPNFTIYLMERWRSGLLWGPRQTPPYGFDMPPIASFGTLNMSLAYLFKSPSGVQTELYLNVMNLFNQVPPQADFFGNGGPGTFGGFALGDDPEGRYFTLGFRARF